MPTLSEILQDPNYINANEATRRAIFERYAPQDTNYTGANEATQYAIKQRFGVLPGAVFTPPKPEPESAFRQVADVPLGLAKGAVQGVRMIADAFGAGSDTSSTIKGAEGYLAGLMSAQSKNDQQEIARIMKDAEDKGVADQVLAAVKAFSVAPVDMLSSALGTAAPAIVGALGAKLLGAGALLTAGVSAVTGAGMGAGTVKGTIYEETKKALLEAKVPEAEAEQKAQLAQEYGGKNLDQILLGTGLGALASVGPVEKGMTALLARRISANVAAREATEAAAEGVAKSALAQRAKAGLAEALPEALQAGQEQVAANIALQREGFNVPTMRGAYGAATLEGLAGMGLGAIMPGGRAGAEPEAAPAPAPIPPEADLQGAEDVTGTEPPSTGGGFEISEVPTGGELAGVAGATPPTGVGAAGAATGQPFAGASPESLALIEAKTTEIAKLEAENAERKTNLQADIANRAPPQKIEARQKKLDATAALIDAKKNELAAFVSGLQQAAAPAPVFTEEEIAGTPPAPVAPPPQQTQAPRSGLSDTEVGGAPAVETTPPATLGARQKRYNELDAAKNTRKLTPEEQEEYDDLDEAASFGLLSYPKPPATKPATEGVTPSGTETVEAVKAEAQGQAAPPAQPELAAPDFLTSLGVSPTAALRKRVEGKSPDDPQVRTELEKYAKNPKVSAETKQKIAEYLKPAAAAPALAAEAAPAPAVPALPAPTENIGADLAALRALRDKSKSRLPSKGKAKLTEAQEAENAPYNAFGKKYGVTRLINETNEAYLDRIVQAVEMQEEIGPLETGGKGIPASQVSPKLAVAQTVEPTKPYTPPLGRRERYDQIREEFNKTTDEEDAKLPEYEALTDYEKRLYFQEISNNSKEQHDKAAKMLSGYLESKRGATRTEESAEGKEKAAFEVKSRDVYNKERGAAGAKTSINYTFPSWNDLSDDSRQAFMSFNKTNSALEIDQGFRAVKEQIRKEKAEQQRVAYLSEAEAEVQVRQRLELEEALRKQPSGKGEKLSDEVVDALLRGDVVAALKILAEKGQGLKGKTHVGSGLFGVGRFSEKGKKTQRVTVRDSIARAVFRSLANVLSDIPGFKVNIVKDENMSPDTFGEYDAKTNTIYVSPNGMDEATLLHELVHAATVQIIHKYFTDKASLTPRAIAAVEHLQNIAIKARTALPSKYSNAFENLYEFVAYAMTDMDFQYALSRVQIESLGKFTKENAGTEYMASEIGEREAGDLEPPAGPTLWNYFTDTLAWLYKIFTPSSTSQAFFAPTERTGLSKSARGEPIRRRKSVEAEEAEIDTEEAVIPRAKEDLYTYAGMTNLRKVINVEPGYRGNLLLEVTAAFQDILAAPEGGIERLAGKEALGTRLQSKAEDQTSAWTQSLNEKDRGEAVWLYNQEDSLSAKIDDAKAQVREAEDKASTYAARESQGKSYNPDTLAALKEQAQWIKENRLSPLEQELADVQSQIAALKRRVVSGTRLQSKAKPTTKQAGAPSEETDEQFMDKLVGDDGQLRLRDRGLKSALRNLFSREGYENVVQKFQNERRVIKRIFDRAEKLGVVKYLGTGINDVSGQLTRSTGMAVDIYETNIKPLSDEVHSAVEAYAEKLNIPISKALSHIHVILEARHEPERRKVKFLLNVPLDDQKKYTIKGFNDEKGNPLRLSPAAWRQYILEQLSRPDLAPTEAARKQKAKDFRGILEQITSNTAMRGAVNVSQTDPVLRQQQIDAIFNKDSELYSVIASRTSAEIARMKKLFDKKEYKTEIDRVVDAVKAIQKETERLNKESNYWSAPVQNIVDFYGYKNYVPFKGRPGATQLDDETDLNSKRIGGELQEMQDSFEGRKSESENPLLQTLAESASAALRAGRKDLTLAIKNAIKDKILSGKPLTEKSKIAFGDRYLRGETKKELGGPNKIFHYNEDGTIDVLELTDNRQVEAIRRGYRESSPLIDKLNSATSFVGQTHTRYNPAFAPMNFVRDSLTNAYLLGAEFGPKVAGQLIKAVSAQVANGGPYRTMRYAKLYADGKFEEIERLKGGDAPYDTLTPEQKYYRDISDYVKLGGKVSYLQGVAAKGALDNLLKDIGRSQVIKTKEQADKFFDIYNEMFEFAARVAAFRVLRGQFLAEGSSAEEAQVRAVTYAKNLANFEQVGKYGKTAGAFFMFFRPAATGAVRAIDSLIPAFGFDEADFRLEEKNKGRTDEQINRAVGKMREERDNARRMSAVLAGAGIAMYYMAQMMGGDDEQKRNRVSTDDMARWTRYARFFIPGVEKPIQIPWGFGPGAFAAAGAQMAAVAGSGGRVGIGEALSNIALIGLDSFLPLPFSRISPLDNFPAFAIDSLLPSVARPFVEYVMNLDGLGREIYNNRQSRYGDAYTGGDNIPEMYKSVARWMYNNLGTGEIDVSPNVLYFFANNYFDGFAKFLSSGYNLGLTLAGQKDFDLKNDALFAGSFIGTKSNVDAREFSKAETYIKGLEKRLKSLESVNPQKFGEYVREHPEEYALVHYYNQQVNGTLRDLRKNANMIRASRDMTPKERKEKLDQIVDIQNMVKRQILLGAETISGYKP